MRFAVAFIAGLLSIYTQTISAQQWSSASKIGGSGNEHIYAMCTDATGNSYTIGSFKGKVAIDTIELAGSTKPNVFLTKYSAHGTVIWARIVASAVSDFSDVTGYSLAVDASGAIFIAGGYTGEAEFYGTLHTSIAPTEIFTAKLTSEGDLLWLRTAGGTGSGTFNPNSAFAIATDPSGNCIVAGRYCQQATFDTVTVTSMLPAEMFVVFYDSDGHVRWANSGNGDFGIHTVSSVACDKDGNVYLTGAFFGTLILGENVLDAGDPEQKIFICKLSPTGEVVWAKKVGTGGYYGGGNDLALDAAGNPLCVGYFRANLDIGEYHFTHNTPTITYAALAVKYSAAGDLLWAQAANGTEQSSTAAAAAFDPAGNACIAGSYNGVLFLGETTLPITTTSKTFVAAIDESGQWLWATTTASGGNNYGVDIATVETGALLVAGEFNDSVTFASQNTLIASGGSDIFIAGLPIPSASVDSPGEIIKPEIETMPNPASDHIQINYHLPAGTLSGYIAIRDTKGAELQTHPLWLTEGSISIDVHDLSPGVYYCCLLTDNGRTTVRKMMVVR